jgi:hypothetical protein
MAYFNMLHSVLKQALTKRLVLYEERTFDVESFTICKTPIHRLIQF